MNFILNSNELIFAIVDYNMGSKVLNKAKEYGITSGTIFIGRGTINNGILNFLSITNKKKEIVLMGTNNKIAREVMENLNRDFRFYKPNTGIIFSTKIYKMLSTTQCLVSSEMEDKNMYQLITTIVNRGLAEDVIDAAKECGANGGTIINARGSGVHETAKVFNMDIEPEKEIVIIILKKEFTQKVLDNINKKLKIEEPGNGISFVQDIAEVYGVYE